jgi:GDP-D-mannose dehydratase
MDGEGIYAQSKIEARKLIDYYRDEFAINAGTAILFNHESKYRKSGFLFVEIAKQINEVVSMKRNRIDVLDANIMADWHSARDTVQALEIISQLIVILK